MLNAYKSTHMLTKVFIWFTILLVAIILAYYVQTVQNSLTQDPHSFNCTADSLMMEFCHDPFGMSAKWTLGLALIAGWPVLLAWLALAIVIRVRYVRDLKKAVAAAEAKK